VVPVTATRVRRFTDAACDARPVTSLPSRPVVEMVYIADSDLERPPMMLQEIVAAVSLWNSYIDIPFDEDVIFFLRGGNVVG